MKKYFLLGLLFLAQGTFAVSRVGGGKVQSQSSGFEMSVPLGYDRVESYGIDAVIAKGPQAYIRNQGVVELFVRIAEFEREFPDAKKMTAPELSQRFTLAGWQQVTEFNFPCVLIFTRNQGSLVSYIATWGAGKGFVLNGPAMDSVDISMREMLGTLKLEAGSCSWK